MCVCERELREWVSECVFVGIETEQNWDITVLIKDNVWRFWVGTCVVKIVGGFGENMFVEIRELLFISLKLVTDRKDCWDWLVCYLSSFEISVHNIFVLQKKRFWMRFYILNWILIYAISLNKTNVIKFNVTNKKIKGFFKLYFINYILILVG